MSRIKKSVEEKVQTEMPEFASEIASLSSEELTGRLAQLAKDAEAIEDAKEADEELERTKAQVTELSAPYRDGKKAIRLKSRYIIALLKDRGAA